MPCAPPSAGLFAVENLSHHLVTKINRDKSGERRKGRIYALSGSRHGRIQASRKTHHRHPVLVDKRVGIQLHLHLAQHSRYIGRPFPQKPAGSAFRITKFRPPSIAAVLTVSLAADCATKSNFNREFIWMTGSSASTWRKKNAGSDASKCA